MTAGASAAIPSGDSCEPLLGNWAVNHRGVWTAHTDTESLVLALTLLPSYTDKTSRVLMRPGV